MKLSASMLSELSTCEYKYYLTRIKGMVEPGKKSYNMLQGDIVADAIQACSLILNKNKTLSDEDISRELVNAYRTRFEEAGIDLSLIDAIEQLIYEGITPELMNELDNLSIVISCSPKYEFKQPPPLKRGNTKTGYSTDKKRMGPKVIKTWEDVNWFFMPKHPHYALIRDAVYLANEKVFEAPINEPYSKVINGEEIPQQDYIVGRYDQLLQTPGEDWHILEFKYTSTAYDQGFVDRAVQINTYAMALGAPATVTLFDLAQNRYYTTKVTDEMQDLTRQRFFWARKTVEHQIFKPACGTDPYTTGNMLCGFKCGGCPFVEGTNPEMVEE